MQTNFTEKLNNHSHYSWWLDMKTMFLETILISLKTYQKTNNEYFKQYAEETKKWIEETGQYYERNNQLVRKTPEREPDRQRLLPESDSDIEEIVQGIIW